MRPILALGGELTETWFPQMKRVLKTGRTTGHGYKPARLDFLFLLHL